MKVGFLATCASVMLLSVSAAFSQPSADTAHLEKSIRDLTYQVHDLQRQIHQLTHRRYRYAKHRSHARPTRIRHRRALARSSSGIVTRDPLHAIKARKHKQPHRLRAVYMAKVKHRGYFERLHAQYLTLGTSVTTSPFTGLRSKFDASDLIVNLPTMNEDLRLLKQKETLAATLPDGLPSVKRPHLEITGDVAGRATFMDPYRGAYASDIDLSCFDLQFYASVSPWAFGFISFSYDNGFKPDVITGSGSRVKFSNVFLQRGFVTIGNLAVSPVYGSVGQMYVPFGRYASMMVSLSNTALLGRTNARAAVLGVTDYGVYAQAYAFRGDVHTGAGNRINQGGFNLGYAGDFHVNPGSVLSADLGAGWIANIADSCGMQDTGSPVLPGFNQHRVTEIIAHKVPAIDIHSEFTLSPISFYAEYVGAIKHFNASDLRFNGTGARPQALHVEADYHFSIWHRPTGIGFAYGRTWKALPLNLPKESYAGVFSTSIWKNTIESIEFRHDKNYSSCDAAGARIAFRKYGKGGTVFRSFRSVGGESNTLRMQIGIYF